MSSDDPPVFMSYAQEDRPLPENAKWNIAIHHPKLGEFLKAKMDELSIEAILQTGTQGRETEIEREMVRFFERHFTMTLLAQ